MLFWSAVSSASYKYYHNTDMITYNYHVFNLHNYIYVIIYIWLLLYTAAISRNFTQARTLLMCTRYRRHASARAVTYELRALARVSRVNASTRTQYSYFQWSMTYRTKLVSTKNLYFGKSIVTGLAIVDESKFISKANLEIGGEKVIKYGSKNFDNEWLGILEEDQWRRNLHTCCKYTRSL